MGNNCKKTPWWADILALVCVGAIIGVVVLAVLYDQSLTEIKELKRHTTESPSTTVPKYVKLPERINCYPEEEGVDAKWTVSQKVCEQRGCRYEPDDALPGAPPCFMHPEEIGYEVTSVVDGTDAIFKAFLKPLSYLSIFDTSIKNVSITVTAINDKHLQIKIEDASTKRFEVPFPRNSYLKDQIMIPSMNRNYKVHVNHKPFSLVVTRKSTGTVIFDTSMGGFVFSDTFLQLTTKVPSMNVYGLGEHEHPSLRHNMNYKTWPMFARDQPGLGEGKPLYGVHPFYMVMEEDSNSHGVFLLNSNAMEYSMIPAPGIIMRSIGGIFDFHIYLGPTPENVIQQHTSYVGFPYMPPYYALGFQLSRWGYNSLTNMKAAVERTRSIAVPLDAIYADIDHMDERKDFTLDMENFGDLPEYFRNESATNGLRSVIIIDPAVTNNATNYEPWDWLNDNNTYVKWKNGTAMMGYVWPAGDTGFPDFFLDRTKKVWKDLIKKHAEWIGFDGVWIDMNEPANFGTNEEKPFNYPDHLPPRALQCPMEGAVSVFDSEGKTTPLADKTLCMEARQNDGAYKHYDVHNLYGWTESFATHEAMLEIYPTKRPYILSRSTFAGSGSVASHWLGDNEATWTHLQRSIIGMLEMSMFGIAHTGPDICGFFNDASPELCQRWMELGAFYPFSRHHKNIDTSDQDPGMMGGQVAESSRLYMDTRYLLLPYMYTLFFQAHTTGTTVARPMFFEWPEDRLTWGLDRQFMLGKYFMVAPVLEPGQNGVTAYVPQGVWWSYDFTDSFHDFCSGGREYFFNASGPALLQRGASIVAFQHSGGSLVRPKYHIVSTAKSRLEDMFFQILYDCDGYALGELYYDDGESADSIETGKYWLFRFESWTNATNLHFEVKIVHKSTDPDLGKDIRYNLLLISNTPQIKNPVLECASGSCPKLQSLSYQAEIKTTTYTFLGNKMPLVEEFTMTAEF